jgi:hypothetical protein
VSTLKLPTFTKSKFTKSIFTMRRYTRTLASACVQPAPP